MEKKTSIRSSDYEWLGLCIKTPMDKDINEADLEVLMGFNGSVTQGISNLNHILIIHAKYVQNYCILHYVPNPVPSVFRLIINFYPIIPNCTSFYIFTSIPLT